jgi:ribosome-associated protein
MLFRVPDLWVNEQVTIPGGELRVSFVRSGGPGGQRVDKVATKVELRWAPTTSAALSEADRQRLLSRLANRLTGAGELVVTSERTRDQARNREDARAKLAELVREALVPPKPRLETRPTRASRERRLLEKKQRGSKKRSRGPVDES